MSQPEQPLSARLLEHADRLNQLAKLLPEEQQPLASQFIFLAASAGLMHLTAQRQEREALQARRTIAELHAHAAEEADAAEAAARAADPARADRWHRNARTIAALLTPAIPTTRPSHPGQPQPPEAA